MFISRITKAKFAIYLGGLAHVYVSYVISIFGVRLITGYYDDFGQIEIIRSYHSNCTNTGTSYHLYA